MRNASSCPPQGLLLLLLATLLPSLARTQVAPAQGLAHAQPPSSLIQPALDSVAHAGSAVDLNRWKGSNALRDEVDANLDSIQTDLQTTLPPLLSVADAAPASASAALPVLLNLDALYSVLLRVTIASRGAAPREQNTALEQASTLLDSARRDLGNTVLQSARNSEQLLRDLQTSVAQQQGSQPPSQPVAPASAKPATPKAKKRPAATAAR